MNKDAYKKAFEKVRMPDYLEKEILNMTINSLEDKKKRNSFHLQPIVACLILCALFGGVVYASVATGLWSNIFNSSDSGINKSLEYNYAQNVNMEYVMSNGLGFKVESILLDDETFAIVYNLKLDHIAPNFDWVNLEDLVVTDENGVVLYGEGKGMISTGGSFSVASEDNITIKIAHINSNENHDYPKSKKLYFRMSSVNLINSNARTKIVERLTGDWKFEIDMADQFVERRAIQYMPTFNDRLKIRYAELTSTGLNMEIEFMNEKFDISKRMTLVASDVIYENERGISVEYGEKIIRTSFPITIYNAPSKLTFAYDGTSIDLTEEQTNYSQIRDYLSDTLTREFEPYYTDFSFVLYNYKFNLREYPVTKEFIATMFLQMNTKEEGAINFDLQIKGERLADGSIDTNSLEIMSFADGSNKDGMPFDNYFPRNK